MKKKMTKKKRFRLDEWIIYNPPSQQPKKAVILYVYKESERSIYDYEIYIDENPGIYKKVVDKDLQYLDSQLETKYYGGVFE